MSSTRRKKEEQQGEGGRAHFGESRPEVGSDEELDPFYFSLDEHELEVLFF